MALENLNSMEPDVINKKIDFSFYMNIANCAEYPEAVRNEAKTIALNIGMQLGLVPEMTNTQENYSENANMFR